MKILIVGLGSIGKRHLKNLAKLGYSDFIVLTSQDLTQLKELPNLLPETDLESALSHRPAAVFICNPSSLHVPIAIAAAKKGCHIFLEKPVSHTLEGLDELAAIADAKNLKIQVGFQFRYHSVLQEIKRKINGGELGKIIAAHAHWGEWLPGWHPWEDYRNGYSARADLGGGVVLTLCHSFDYLRWLLGEAKVCYALGGKLSKLEIDIEDATLSCLQFESGAIGSVWLDYLSQPAKHTLQIIGEIARVEWNATTGIAMVYHQSDKNVETLFPGRHFERNEMFLDEVSDFLNCIETDRAPGCTLRDGVEALKICLAIKEFLNKKNETRPLETNASEVIF